MADVFDAPLHLTELESYIIATAMQIAAEHTDASEETRLLQKRLMNFITATWSDPSPTGVVQFGRVNIDVGQLDDFMADAARYRTLFDPRNLPAVHGIVERTKAEADEALDCLARGRVRDMI